MANFRRSTFVLADLDQPFDYRLRFVDDVGRSRKSHSICRPDKVLFIAVQRDLVSQWSVRSQLSGVHDEIRIDCLLFHGLTRDPL